MFAKFSVISLRLIMRSSNDWKKIVKAAKRKAKKRKVGKKKYWEKKKHTHKKNEDEANEQTEWKWEISWKYAHGYVVKRRRRKIHIMPKKIQHVDSTVLKILKIETKRSKIWKIYIYNVCSIYIGIGKRMGKAHARPHVHTQRT